MAVYITMPKWGLTMKEGKVSKWFKEEGSEIRKGEDLFEVETEKITNKVESAADGILFQIVVQVGVTVPVGTILAIISEPGEEPERIDGFRIGEVSEADALESQPATQAPPEEAKKGTFVLATPGARRLAKELGVNLDEVAGISSQEKITEADVRKFHDQGPSIARITPLAKEIASKEGVDISLIHGSGERGQIVKEDVIKALEARKAAAKETAARETVTAPRMTSMPYEGMRKMIGDNMMSSLHSTAQLTAFAEVDVTEMVRLRDLMREEYKHDDSIKISYNDIIVLSVSRALKRHPIMNSTLVGGEIILHQSANVGVAVALPRGLIVPVLHNADQKGLLQIAGEARELVAKAREGTLSVDDVTGGTFTVTNTSMYEMDGFTPILRPPETGILGVGRVKRKPAEYKGEIALRWMVVLSLTYDHRVVDGAPAHAFLTTVGRYLQEPYLILS